MKRRSFLKSVLSCLGLVFVPKAKASDLPIESDIYVPNNPNSKIKWRRYATLDKEPEAYTRKDLEPTKIAELDKAGENRSIINALAKDASPGDYWTLPNGSRYIHIGEKFACVCMSELSMTINVNCKGKVKRLKLRDMGTVSMCLIC